MAGEIASAFVRIRPNMSGFKGETEAGVRSGFRDIAKIAGVAFGAAQAFEFGKNIVEHAANVQKQIEGVKDGFGQASEAVLKFSEGGAANLGISAHAAETTANRFAILFRQIGIGPKLAATMTINFEKLAGSIAEIRGIKPEDVLRNLPLALAGNVRSLKQLGIAVDASSLKVAAFKAGITNSVSAALTPGQRALAIYAVATAHLGEFQAQAAKHAGDLYNKDLILSAQWDNAKDRLGKGLLPALSAFTGFLSTILPPAIDGTINAFRLLGRTIGDVAGLIAPALKPVKTLIDGIRSSLGGGLGGVDASHINQQLGEIGKGVDVSANLRAIKRQVAGVAAGTDLADVNKRLAEIGKGVDVSANVAAIRKQLAGLGAGGPVGQLRRQVASLAETARDPGKRTLVARVADELKTLTPAAVGTLSLIKQQVADLAKVTVDPTALQNVRRQVAGLAKGVDGGALARRLSEVAKGVDVGLVNRRLSEIGRGVDVSANVAAIRRQVAGVAGAAGADEVGRINKRLGEIGKGLDVGANVDAVKRQVAGLAAAVRSGLGDAGKVLRPPDVAAINARLADVAKGVDVTANVEKIRQQLAVLGGGADVARVNRRLGEVGRGVRVEENLRGVRRELDALAAGDLASRINRQLKDVGKGVDVAGNLRAVKRELDSLGDTPAVRRVREQLNGLGKGIDASGVKKLRDELDKYSSSKIDRALAGVKAAWAGLSPASKVAVVAIGAVAASLAVAAAAAFPITTAIAAIGGLAIGFQLAKEHSAKFRAVMSDVSDFTHAKVVPALKGIAAAAGPAFKQLGPTARAALGAVRAAFTDVVAAARAIWQRFGGTITTIARTYFGGLVRIVRDAMRYVEGVFKVIGGVLSGDWRKALSGLKEIGKSELDAVLTVFETFGKNVATLFEGIWQNVERVTLLGLAKLTGLLAKVPTKFKALGVTVGVDNPFKGITEGLKGRVAKLDAAKEARENAAALADSAAKALAAKTRDPGIAEAASAVADHTKTELHTKLKAAVSKGVGDGVKAGADDGVRKARAALDAAKTALAEAITQRSRDVADAVSQSKQNLIAIGQSLSDSIATVIDEPYRKAAEQIGLARARITLEFDRASAPLEAQAQRLAKLQQRLSTLGDEKTLRSLRSSILLPGGKPLAAGQAGLKELQDLVKSTAGARNRAPIEDFVQKYQAALLQVQQDKLGVKQSALDARRQSRETALNLRSDALAVGQGVSTLLKETTSRAVSDMTVALNTGELRIGGFYRRLAALLANAHVNVRRAQKLLGTAFADLLQEQVTGIGKQAAANAAGPQRPGTGQAPTIVHPLWVMQKDTAKIARLQESIGNKTLALQTKIEKNTKKAADQSEKLAGVTLGPSSKGLGKQSRETKDLNAAAAG